MHDRLRRNFGRNAFLAGICGALLLAIPALADVQRTPATAEGLKEAVGLIRRGQFEQAGRLVDEAPAAESLNRLKDWLGEYEKRQVLRRELDRAEFDRYVGYAKARVERAEFLSAVDWIQLAADVAENKDEFLSSDWIQDLVNRLLTYAEVRRREKDWRAVWDVYWRLAALFDREPRYEKLERDAVTHLRLELMFRDGPRGEPSNWKERLERVRWDDAEEALEHVNDYYVEPVDFRKVCEAGLEHILLLAESQAAVQTFEGLRREDDRRDFESRIRARLEVVRAASTVNRETCNDVFRRVVRQINRQTVNLPEELLVSELMRGAFDPLDEFTTIIWPEETDEFDKHTRGTFVGVGISIIKNQTGEIEVATPLDDTPAFRAGIQAGDIIAAVEGEPLRDLSISKVVDRIMGLKGTPVNLTIRRNGKDIPFPLIRDEIKIQSVKGVRRDPDRGGKWNHWLDKDQGVAYVRVTNFQKNTVEDVDNALRELKGQGMKGLIVDLRGNPGGLLDSAWQLSSLFLRKGDGVVSTKGRIPEENHRFNATTDGAYKDLPISVLVDESSASASEILSGAIRDNGRGPVIGARTFGKFSVQNLIPLKSKAKLKITTASYYLPSGASLHRKTTSDTWGVEPNVPVRLVRWEKMNIFQLRRDADLLGPPAPKPQTESTDAADQIGDAATDKDDKVESVSRNGELGPDPLPLLKQPDENNRPKEDAQLDTALLVLRATLLDGALTTVAAAEKDLDKQSASP